MPQLAAAPKAAPPPPPCCGTHKQCPATNADEPLCVQLVGHLRTGLASGASDAARGDRPLHLEGVSAPWLESVRSEVLCGTPAPDWLAHLLSVCADEAQACLQRAWSAMGTRLLASARARARREVEAEAEAAAAAARDEGEREAMAAGQRQREARTAHADGGASW